MTIKYIIADGLDLNFYSEREAAEAYIEAIDARAHVYRGYDESGRCLKISPKGESAQITLAEQHPNHADELRDLLVRYLTAIGKPPQTNDLRSLLEICERLGRKNP